VIRALCPSNAKKLYTDETNTEVGEIKEQKTKERKETVKVKRKKRLCCYFV